MNSPKSVVEKLNLSKYPKKLILHKPEEVNDFQDLAYDFSIKNSKYDLIFSFVFNLEEFKRQLTMVIENHLLEDNGYIYFAYPKKNNPQYKEYIERDSLMQAIPVDDDGYVLESNVKFARMVSLNDIFTVVGLKAAPKKTKAASTSKTSQSVDDYIKHVEDIRQYLSNKEEILNTYNELTFGYQKDWARYIYSAKRKETQEKRLVEMETVLGEGYKTIELYKRNHR